MKMMKYLSTICALLILCLLLSSYYSSDKQNIQLKNVQTIATKGFTAPQFSPDDSKLVFSSMKNHGIFISDIAQKNVQMLSELPESGYRATWTLDGQEIVFRHKIRNQGEIPYFEMKSIDLQGAFGEVQAHVKPMNFFTAATTKSPKDPIITMNNETFKVMAHSEADNRKVLVTTDQGNFYRPILSPDRTKVLVHRGAEMLIYAVDGSGLITNLGIGIGGSWSPDGTKILSFLDESSDGHHMTDSELYITDIATLKQTNITNTPHVFEMWPDWSNDGKRIAYSDGHTGEIMVAEIQF